MVDAAFHHDEAVCCDCSTGDPYASVDFETADGHLLFAVRRGRRGKVDRDRAPDAYLRGRGARVSLGHSSA